MDLRLSKKIALITGASKGIGKACAFRLAQEGCDLRLVARSEADLVSLKHELTAKFNVNVQCFAYDLSVGENVKKLIQANQDIDILVNNAGAIPIGDISQIDEATWRQAWDLKVFGYINMCREVFSLMSQRGSGVIINIIGAGGERPSPDYIVGSAGNSALMALSRALGSDSLRLGVRVVGLNPGIIKTGRMETQLRRSAARKWADESRWQELISTRYPPGQPAHIADMTALLVSELSGFTTGTVVTVDGGSSSRYA